MRWMPPWLDQRWCFTWHPRFGSPVRARGESSAQASMLRACATCRNSRVFEAHHVQMVSHQHFMQLHAGLRPAWTHTMQPINRRGATAF